MNKINFWLRNYFAFSQIEIRAFVAMVIIMIGLLLLTFINKFTTITDSYTTQHGQKDQKIMETWIADIAAKQAAATERLNEKREYNQSQAVAQNTAATANLFVFDPNTASEKDFINLGLAAFIAKRIVNYRTKGGRFKQKADFKKMYGLPPEQYEQLAPYINLPETLDKQLFTKQESTAAYTKEANEALPTSTKNIYSPKKPVAFNLNQADTATLKSIKGIGNVLAERISKYRDNLGGFHSLDQLNEVYGIAPEVLEEVKKYATVLPEEVKKINVNTADEATLKKHQYIGYKMASLIVAYRKQHGNFLVAEDLLKIKLMEAEKLQKLKPYLAF
jgi:competence protein ComEA